jgi:hypothetical protein
MIEIVYCTGNSVFWQTAHGGDHPPAHQALSCSASTSLSYTSTNLSILSEILLIGSLVIALLLPALLELFHLSSNNQYLLSSNQSRAPKSKVRTLFQSRTLDSPLTCTVSNPSFQRSNRLGVCFRLSSLSVIYSLLQKHAQSLTRATSAEDTLVPTRVR